MVLQAVVLRTIQFRLLQRHNIFESIFLAFKQCLELSNLEPPDLGIALRLRRNCGAGLRIGVLTGAACKETLEAAGADVVLANIVEFAALRCGS